MMATGINTGIANAISIQTIHTNICAISGANHNAIAVQFVLFMIVMLGYKHTSMLINYFYKSRDYFDDLLLLFVFHLFLHNISTLLPHCHSSIINRGSCIFFVSSSVAASSNHNSFKNSQTAFV